MKQKATGKWFTTQLHTISANKYISIPVLVRLFEPETASSSIEQMYQWKAACEEWSSVWKTYPHMVLFVVQDKPWHKIACYHPFLMHTSCLMPSRCVRRQNQKKPWSFNSRTQAPMESHRYVSGCRTLIIEYLFYASIQTKLTLSWCVGLVEYQDHQAKLLLGMGGVITKQDCLESYQTHLRVWNMWSWTDYQNLRLPWINLIHGVVNALSPNGTHEL